MIHPYTISLMMVCWSVMFVNTYMRDCHMLTKDSVSRNTQSLLIQIQLELSRASLVHRLFYRPQTI